VKSLCDNDEKIIVYEKDWVGENGMMKMVLIGYSAMQTNTKKMLFFKLIDLTPQTINFNIDNGPEISLTIEIASQSQVNKIFSTCPEHFTLPIRYDRDPWHLITPALNIPFVMNSLQK